MDTLESLQVVNRELLDESCGGDPDFARELFADLSSRSGELQREMQAASHEKDAERMRKAAHELKGSSLTLGAERVGHISRELEDFARKSDLAACEPWLARLDSELETLKQHLVAEGLA